MNRVRKVNRRDFIKTGGVFVVGVSLAGCSKPETPAAAATVAAEPPAPVPWEADVYVSFDAEGLLHIICHRSEMGQGIRTGLPVVVADEMGADWEQVVVDQATGDEKYGNQNTDGSWSVRGFMHAMREAGASVRLMLEQSAANQWGVDVSECHADMHTVVHEPSGNALPFRDLVAGAAKLPVPSKEQIKLKNPDQFRYIGKALPIVDMHDMTHGTAIYGADVRVPGMVFAAIARPPVVFGKVKSFDADEARQVAGVIDVVEMPALEAPAGFKAVGGVAVIADNSWAALKARDKLKIEWDDGPNAGFDSGPYREQLLASVRQAGKPRRDQGTIDQALSEAASTLEREYYAPMLAHASMEPPAAVASVSDTFCEVWAPTQNPQSLIEMVNRITGLEKENIRINVTLLGGAFGRKSKCDFAEEAVVLSKIQGKPVLVLWTREDDIQHDYYHSDSAQHLTAGFAEDGAVTAWRHRLNYPTIMSTFDTANKEPADMELGLGAINMPYAIPNVRLETGEIEAGVRIGWLRSVCNIFQSFAINAFTDEIAEARGVDPVQNLLDLIGEDRELDFEKFGYSKTEGYPFLTGRLRNVVNTVAEKAGWGRDLPAGHGLGIAAQYSFLSYVAAVVEVAVDDQGAWRVPRVDIVIDCGQFVNSDRVRAQMEGSAVFGLSLAREGAITAADGRIQQSNFHNYPLVRMHQSPETHVTIMESDAPPAGVGEPGVPPIAPALVNALFAATGKRFRELPLGTKLKL